MPQGKVEFTVILSRILLRDSLVVFLWDLLKYASLVFWSICWSILVDELQYWIFRDNPQMLLYIFVLVEVFVVACSRDQSLVPFCSFFRSNLRLWQKKRNHFTNRAFEPWKPNSKLSHKSRSHLWWTLTVISKEFPNVSSSCAMYRLMSVLIC